MSVEKARDSIDAIGSMREHELFFLVGRWGWRAGEQVRMSDGTILQRWENDDGSDVLTTVAADGTMRVFQAETGGSESVECVARKMLHTLRSRTHSEWQVGSVTEMARLYDPWCAGEHVRFDLHQISAYMRCCDRQISIVSIEVDEQVRGQGRFRAFLREVEQEAARRGWGVRVESVANPILAGALGRYGYSDSDDAWFRKAADQVGRPWPSPRNRVAESRCG